MVTSHKHYTLFHWTEVEMLILGFPALKPSGDQAVHTHFQQTPIDKPLSISQATQKHRLHFSTDPLSLP
jgi:hypothetical protein